MKVLFYFKMDEVYTPNGSSMKKDSEKKEDGKNQNFLTFTMLCIKQTDPELKLEELLRVKKLPEDINKFVKRFGIDELTKSKKEWEVSERSEKDIENLLL